MESSRITFFPFSDAIAADVVAELVDLRKLRALGVLRNFEVPPPVNFGEGFAALTADFGVGPEPRAQFGLALFRTRGISATFYIPPKAWENKMGPSTRPKSSRQKVAQELSSFRKHKSIFEH